MPRHHNNITQTIKYYILKLYIKSLDHIGYFQQFKKSIKKKEDEANRLD